MDYRESILIRYGKNWRTLAELDGAALGASTKVGKFIERYIICEAIARNQISRKIGRPCPHTLNFTQIQAAVRYYGLGDRIAPQLIESIFRGGDGTKGARTPRQLRNGLIHGLSEAHRGEVEMRHDSLMSLMNRWLRHYC